VYKQDREKGQSLMSEMSISWGELAQLNHATQVAGFGFCLCEDIADDQDTPYADCPREGENK